MFIKKKKKVCLIFCFFFATHFKHANKKIQRKRNFVVIIIIDYKKNTSFFIYIYDSIYHVQLKTTFYKTVHLISGISSNDNYLETHYKTLDGYYITSCNDSNMHVDIHLYV
jgi:hypothetical protein